MRIGKEWVPETHRWRLDYCFSQLIFIQYSAINLHTYMDIFCISTAPFGTHVGER